MHICNYLCVHSKCWYRYPVHLPKAYQILTLPTWLRISLPSQWGQVPLSDGQMLTFQTSVVSSSLSISSVMVLTLQTLIHRATTVVLHLQKKQNLRPPHSSWFWGRKSSYGWKFLKVIRPWKENCIYDFPVFWNSFLWITTACWKGT